MSKKETDVLTVDELEKSWGDSTELLKSIIGNEEKDDLQKSKKKDDLSKAKKDDEEESEEDESEESDMEEDSEEESEESEEEESDEDKKKMKKSLADEMEADEESAAAMDVEPFLRKFVKSMSSKLDDITSLNKSLRQENARLTGILAKSILSLGDQNMTIAATVDAIANTPVGSKSVIRKSMDRFEDKGGDKQESEGRKLIKSMSHDDILEKALDLTKKGKLTSHDVAKINTRLNKGMELEEGYVRILTAKEEK